MSKLDIKIPHQLPEEEALLRVREILAGLEEKYAGSIRQVTQGWDGHEGRFGFTAKGFTLKGKVYVGVDTVRISSQLPFILSLYRTKITQAVEAKGAELLCKRNQPN